MLYVHSSKAEEFDLKTIARIPADLIILANCDGVILYFVSLHELLAVQFVLC